MTAGARIAALIVGLAGLIACLAAFIREMVLASDETVVWQLAEPVRRLFTETGWATSVAAAVTAALAVTLFALAARQSGAADGGPAVIQFQDEAGWARLNVHAMERGMSRGLQAALPGVRVAALQLRKSGELWRVTVWAEVPAGGLYALRDRMHGLLSDDLMRTGGMRLDRLDLIVERQVA